MTALSYDLAAAYTTALDATTLDLRALHDTDKSLPGHAKRGTLQEHWAWIEAMNAAEYGIFMTPAEMDGAGRMLENVQTIRAHYIDLDNASAQQNYELATKAHPAPGFAVVSSPGKYHIYWVVTPYPADLNRFEQVQRKLRQCFDGDRAVIDAARVMRLPGTLSWKYGSPGHLVTCHALAGYGQPTTVEALEAALAHVVVIDGGTGERHPLGSPELAAPSLAWLKRALDLVDPNELDRSEWIAMTAAIKQAGWTLMDEGSLFSLWSEWCSRYANNDQGENHKQFHSIRSTELGWHSLVRRVPSLKAAVSFGDGAGASMPTVPSAIGATPPMPAGVTEPPPLDCSGEFLSHLECQTWFAGCSFITKLGTILGPNGRFMNSAQFNGAYGGKKFIISGDGKATDEAWKAATRSTLWTIPKVDHVRFLPQMPQGAITTDSLGRSGVNIYKPAVVRVVEGDVTPFMDHLARMIPDEGDQRILIEYLAHNVKFPGYKIPWAPVVQSTEGIGKGVLKKLITHAFGRNYIYFPNAKELTSSGSQFNNWMRNKLFILADEIKVDDKRDLVEILKPMISEELIEMQSKGVDQDMEDNFSNWLFFSNYKDAVPINKNGRRYAIFYSPIQTEQDLVDRGMDEAYFDRIYSWLDADGAAIVTHWLRNYPIERGAIKMRAPKTTSWDEAVKISRSPIERAIAEAVESNAPGFAGGWVSEIAAMKRIRELQAVRGNVPPHAIKSVLESMGYQESGRQMRPYIQEDKDRMGVLYYYGVRGDVTGYGVAQGYE